MEEILQQIDGALAARLFYVALYTAITIPDIAGSLESDDGFASQAKYAAWFDRYMGPEYGRCLSGDDCYYFRCRLIHQGTAQLSGQRPSIQRIFFVEPRDGNIIHRNSFDIRGSKALLLDVSIFCKDMVEQARAWLPVARSGYNFARNDAKSIRRHPSGLHPYVIGLPVIA